MFFLVENRLKVQRNKGKDIYYIPVINGSTSHELPFSSPVADFEVLSMDSAGITDYIAPIRFDDIVTLETSIRFNEEERKVWERLFEGRLLTHDSQFGVQNTAKLNCVGHADETRYTLIETAHNWTNSDIMAIFVVLYQENLTRLIGNEELIMSGYYNTITKNLTTYNLKANQKTFKDFLLDLEKITGYTWYCSVSPQYNPDGTLKEPVIINVLPLPTTPTTKYKIIEGTPRFISASFSAQGENVYTRAIELGQTTAAGVQFNGWAENVTASAKYGKRFFTETDTGFSSNQMCADFAAGIVENFSEPKISGQVVLLLTPEAKIGDYVETRIKSITLNGSPINYYLTVHKVAHNIEECTTTLDVGFKIDDPDKYLLYFAKMAKLSMANFVN
jgi:hypothetical protein